MRVDQGCCELNTGVEDNCPDTMNIDSTQGSSWSPNHGDLISIFDTEFECLGRAH